MYRSIHAYRKPLMTRNTKLGNKLFNHVKIITRGHKLHAYVYIIVQYNVDMSITSQFVLYRYRNDNI